MSSTVHRRVMLRPWYRAGGFGVVRDGPRVWVVEIFLSPALGADGERAAASSDAILEAPDPALAWAALMAGDGDLAAGPFGDRSGAPPPSSLWVSALLLWLAVAAGHAARTIARRR